MWGFKPKTPKDLVDKFKNVFNIVNWVNWHILYSKDSIGRTQSPEETLRTRKADCVDYAVLFCGILRELGYQPEVWGGFGKPHHAIVVYKTENGWNYISNTKMVHSYANTAEECAKIALTGRDIVRLRRVENAERET